MASRVPSIQAFFQKEVPSLKNPKPAQVVDLEAGDGFTSSEIQTALHQPLHQWQPRCTYTEVDIGDLQPGPGCMIVQGRIVNFYQQTFSSKMPHAAKGSFKLIVKDDTGALTVKLHYARVDYGLRLGQLVSVWTPHVSNADSGSLATQDAPLVASIFPEGDNSCYLMVQEDSDEGVLCKTPLGYRDGKQLLGLITLKSFIEGGHEFAEAKVLVCVKSIGGRKTFTTKKGIPSEKVDVRVFDNTADAAFVLWGSSGVSAAHWKPSHTIILLSHAGLSSSGRPQLSINKDTHVDVDPLMTDAYWLRGHAESLTKHEHVNQAFPEGVFDAEAAATAENRILFTLADIDEFARAAPAEHFIGYLSLTVVELNIFSLYQREKLLCNECCGVPIFANATAKKCKQCDEQVFLRINPRLVGLLIDESGGVISGKLVWSDDAWWQLLGRTADELAGSNAELLKYLENRLMFLKLIVMFGWSAEVGKLVVLRVQIA